MSASAGNLIKGPLPESHPIRVRAALRRERALELKVKGWTNTAIAAELNVSRQAVDKMIRKELDGSARNAESSADRMRALENERLDRLLESVWEEAATTLDLRFPEDHELPKNSRGNVDMHALTSMILDASTNRLQAVKVVVAISKRRAALYGLDKPITHLIEGGEPIQIDVKHRILGKLEEMAARASELEAGAPVLEAVVEEDE